MEKVLRESREREEDFLLISALFCSFRQESCPYSLPSPAGFMLFPTFLLFSHFLAGFSLSCRFLRFPAGFMGFPLRRRVTKLFTTARKVTKLLDSSGLNETLSCRFPLGTGVSSLSSGVFSEMFGHQLSRSSGRLDNTLRIGLPASTAGYPLCASSV